MPVIARSAACALCLWMAAAAADETQKIHQVLRDLSAALEQGNAVRFLSLVDRKRCPEYAALEDNLVALLAQNEVGSSIGVIEQSKSEDAYELKLDWLLELRPAGGAAPSQRRHENVTCRIEPGGRRWKVTLLAPVAFFRPL